MASYQTQILDAPPQYGLIPGIAQGMEKFSNAYGEAAVKDMFDRKKKKKTQEEVNEYTKAMQEGGYEMDSSTVDENGDIKQTWKKKETPESTFTGSYSKDPQKIIKQAMGGILPGAQMEQLGQAQGIQPQQRMPMDRESLISRAILSPNLSRMGGLPDIPGMQNIPKPNIPSMPFSLTPMNVQGEQFTEYPDVVRQENLKRFAPGFTEEQVKRDVMGLPTETPAEKLAAEQAKIPTSFTDDVQNLKGIAKGDAEVFVAGLERLALKYTDNPDVLDRIKLIRTIFSGQEPAEFKPDVTLQ